jgi:phosphopantothenoylcysteine decarboxylase / phosphopantothenate---cysteine ligase
MAGLDGKRIVLGLSGGIAAYKSAELTRALRQAGAQVRVVMTAAAQAFITPLTLQALSGYPVGTSLLDPTAEAAMGHIELARWAELIMIAPASADLIARLAHGQADDLLTTLVLASAAPLAIAPAMNQQMWAHAAVRANLELLAARGVHLLGPADGRQACGDVGPGRMLEPDALLAHCKRLLSAPLLRGRRVLINAGPTVEDIDPVRYIGNRSSGQMGFALATAAVHLGAQVTVVAGPVALSTPEGVRRIDVRSALEMREAMHAALPGQDLILAVAAVADYRPLERATHKLKRSAATLTLEFTPNPDIVAELARVPGRGYLVAFAAETDQVLEHARGKLLRKAVDAIAANRVGAGLGIDTADNALTLIDANQAIDFPMQPKPSLAHALLAELARRLPQ